jgi:hypothetical protein
MNFVLYSVVMDESTDATDTAQLAIFVRGLNDSFKIMEELAALGPHNTTKAACVQLCKTPSRCVN